VLGSETGHERRGVLMKEVQDAGIPLAGIPSSITTGRPTSKGGGIPVYKRMSPRERRALEKAAKANRTHRGDQLDLSISSADRSHIRVAGNVTKDTRMRLWDALKRGIITQDTFDMTINPPVKTDKFSKFFKEDLQKDQEDIWDPVGPYDVVTIIHVEIIEEVPYWLKQYREMGFM
jgi:hypothetical protein